MKKLLLIVTVGVVAWAVASCSKDDTPEVKTKTPINEVRTGVLKSDQTWTADRIYELKGRVIVGDGVTLTIKPGTIIKGQEGEKEGASVLIVARGGKINAVGTADKPIIFTTVLDKIKVGETKSTLKKENNNTWGGVIILGKAPISAKQGDTEAGIEGLPPNETYGKYGGSDAADNSGTLKYVSIRFGGVKIGEGNEINGLTLGGVGSGTTIEQVEVFATFDDGIEFFGGTVNVSNAVVTWQGDDGIDIDQNYSGTVTNFVVYHGKGVSTDEGLEIDGPEGATHKTGLFTLKNGTIKSDGVEGATADLKSDAQGTLDNIVFKGYASGKDVIKVEAEYEEGDCSDHTAKNYNDALQNLINGRLVILNTKASGIKVASKKNKKKQAHCANIPVADKQAAEAKFASSSTAKGADESVFKWTQSAKAGLLKD